MKPDNPLQILKAVPRYAAVPVKRWSPSGPPIVVFFGPRPLWGKAIKDHPGSRVIPRTLSVGSFEFSMSLAPWILADRRASVMVAGVAPAYLKAFCKRNRVPLKTIPVPAAKAKVVASKPKPPAAAAPTSIPTWFRRASGTALKQALSGDAPVFLYMPWIPEHGDAIIDLIEDPAYVLAPFDIIRGVGDNNIRREAFRIARNNPDLYRRMVIRRLAPIAARVSGFIFTFDWAPVTRIVVEACRTLGIPTILVPHESAFINQALYYRDPITSASMPACDMVLAWGRLQKDIFVERGYDEERITVVGAPKFDIYHSPSSQLDRARFHRLFGLDPERRTILFATQPLDSQTDTQVARESQRAAIRDLLRHAETHDVQLLVRLPPSRDDILGPELRTAVASSDHGAVDDAEFYLVAPNEAIKHVDVVASINSTMLFEALLAGKPAISMRYIEFESIWDRTGVLVARNLDEAAKLLDSAFAGELKPSEDQLSWAAEQFGVGRFDGQASDRIRAFLRDSAVKPGSIDRHDPIDNVRHGKRIDVVAIPRNAELEETTQKHLRELINANTLLRTPPKVSLKHAAPLSGVDAFLQWGAGDTPDKSAQRALARALGKPTIIVEDGLIRSVEIGLSRTPGLSLLVDDRGAYYDATRRSGLEALLEDGPELSPTQTRSARDAIETIVSARVSKYNHAPDGELDGNPRPAVLVVDQRMDDQSVLSGLAGPADFEQMVLDALAQWPEHDVIIKQHPDATLGGLRGYLTASRLMNAAIVSDRIRVIDYDINPYALFDRVDDVYVVTSGMGFEALMAGKRVHCYGMPFYAGWGLTDDRKSTPRRTRNRSLEAVFHFAYVQATRYFDPEAEKLVSVEQFVDYIGRSRDAASADREPDQTTHLLVDDLAVAES